MGLFLKFRNLILLLSAASLVGATAPRPRLSAPFGLQWGSGPDVVNGTMGRTFKDVSSEAPMPDRLLYERRYEGTVLGLRSDHIAPLFFGARLFGVAASFTPTAGAAASAIWETLVDRLTKELGPPTFRSKPQALLSWNAILSVLPPEANKTELMTVYNAAEKDPAQGKFLLADLQAQVGFWVPEATWTFANGSVVKVMVRAAGVTAVGFAGLKPTVLYTSYEELR